MSETLDKFVEEEIKDCIKSGHIEAAIDLSVTRAVIRRIRQEGKEEKSSINERRRTS